MKRFKLLIILFNIVFIGSGSLMQICAEGFRADHMVLDSITNGKSVFAATQSGLIQSYHLKTKKTHLIYRSKPLVVDGLPAPVYSLSLNDNGKLLAAGTGGSGNIVVLNVDSKKIISKIKLKDIENVLVVRFFDDKNILAGLMDGSIRMIQWKTEKLVYQAKVALDPITSIRVSPNKKRILVTSNSSVISLLDSNSGKIITEMDGHKDTVYNVAFISNRKFISVSKDRSLLLWDLNSKRFEVLYKSPFFINSVAWDGKGSIAFALPDFKIGLMTLSNRSVFKTFKGHTAFINTLQFFNGNRLLSSGNDARVLLHDY